jgi:hypothetical protein
MDDSLGTTAQKERGSAAVPYASSSWIGWSSLFMAFVQSVCAAFVALNGLHLLIGAAAFATATGILGFADTHFHHINAIRIPMVLLALAGAVFNLLALWQVRRLRGRSASAWRQKPISAGKRNSERAQFVLSALTIVLLAVEEWYHFKFTRGF